jgi:hypothetical protein
LGKHDGKFNRNKHTLVKRSYFREQVIGGIIEPQHLRTEEMPADMGTKPLPRKLMTRHMKAMGMVKIH